MYLQAVRPRHYLRNKETLLHVSSKQLTMNENYNQLQEWSELDCDADIDFAELESKLDSELEEQMADLEGLELDREEIGNPDTIGHTVMNVVWEQFINQIGVIAGEDFIKENRGLPLDLRKSAHIQTTENFQKGNIATHNDKIDFQQRYDDQQAKLLHDENGNVVTHPTRFHKKVAKLTYDARRQFDRGRPTGSAERGTDVDHIIPVAEIVRDPAINAHLSIDEQVAFANSDVNLQEIDAAHNRSKQDKSVTEWLDNPNSNGQKPSEALDFTEEQEKQYRNADKAARTELDKQVQEGEQRSINTGKESRKMEAKRIGGKALRSVVMTLLASLVKDIISKLISWFRSGSRKLSSFIDSIKEAIKSFVSSLKQRLLDAGNTLVTTITTAIFGPVIGMIKKAWVFLKQGYKSIKDAVRFLKDPANKDMPFSLKMMQVGKIVIVGLTAGGAIALSELIEKALLSIPGFALNIPLLGSLANLIGLFLGSLVCGLIGALALNKIDRLIAKKLKSINTQQQIGMKNEILATQSQLNSVVTKKVEKTRNESLVSIKTRHVEAVNILEASTNKIMGNSEEIDANVIEDAEIIDENSTFENDEALDSIWNDLKSLN